MDADPAHRPVWLAGGSTTPGYQGRWGNRVQYDPLNRRVGPLFPDFVAMLFDGLGK